MPGSNFHFPFWIDFKIWYHSQNCSEKFNFYLPTLPPLPLILPPSQMACNILTWNSALQNEKLVSTNLFTVRNILWNYFKCFAFRRKRIIRGTAHCCAVIYWVWCWGLEWHSVTTEGLESWWVKTGTWAGWWELRIKISFPELTHK